MSLKPKRINFDEKWDVLRSTVKLILTLDKIERCEWNSRFEWVFNVFYLSQGLLLNIFSYSSDVYSICVAYPEPMADRLYSETKLFLESHVQSLLKLYVDYSEDSNQAQSENSILYKYYKAWKEYSQGLEYLNSLYSWVYWSPSPSHISIYGTNCIIFSF